MDSLPWGTGNSLKASPAVRRKGEQRSFFSASRVGQGRGDSSFPHCTHQSLRVTERQNYRSFSSPQDSDPSPFCPFLPGSSFPLISGAVSILSSLCRAPISSPRHWTLEKAPPQLHKHTLTCCPKVKSLVSFFMVLLIWFPEKADYIINKSPTRKMFHEYSGNRQTLQRYPIAGIVLLARHKTEHS